MLAGALSLWRTNDASTGSPPTWTAIKSSTGSVITAIAIAQSDSNVIWVAHANGTVFKTVNGLDVSPVWTAVTVPTGSKLRIHIDRTNADRIGITAVRDEHVTDLRVGVQ